MTARWAVDQELAVVASGALSPATTTPANTTAFDTGTMRPGDRVLFVVRAVGDDAENTGGVLSCAASATSGGSYTALTSHVTGSLPTGTDAGVALVSAQVDPARPWVRLVVTGADADADMTVNVVALGVARA